MSVSTKKYPAHPLKLFKLFSRYNEGIRLSDTMIYSVTPERIAHKLAEEAWKMGLKYVVDGCGGCGGNSIAFAAHGFHVALVETNIDTLHDAIHNSEVYMVDEWIQFFHRDILSFDCLEEAGFEPKETLFFTSPEWGGPKYIESTIYDLERLNPSISKILEYSRSQGYIKTAIFVPRTSNIHQAEELGCYECEYLFLNGWCSGLCLWFDLKNIKKTKMHKSIEDNME